MENCDNLGFSVETEDLERYIPHISTGMNVIALYNTCNSARDINCNNN